MLKNYKLGFDVWSWILFIIIIIPNFIWKAVPAPNDILRVEPITVIFDVIASICQVFMVVALCVCINQSRKKLVITKWIIVMILCSLLYFVSWIFYYIGTTNALVILGLSIPPCLAFLFFAIDRKNVIAIVPILIFTICHLIYGVVNFIM